jgi:hypothetical protein
MFDFLKKILSKEPDPMEVKEVDPYPMEGVNILSSAETMMNVLAFAERAGNNPMVLKTLIRAIGMKRQSDLILALPKCPQGQSNERIPHYRWRQFLFPWADQFKVAQDPAKPVTISLASDVILPWPWAENRYLERHILIGKDVPKKKNHKDPSWTQDRNHEVTLVRPLNFAFVNSGNHSIMVGVMKQEGFVVPEVILDITPIFSDLMLTPDFSSYSYKGESMKIRDHEMATAIELCRRLVAQKA